MATGVHHHRVFDVVVNCECAEQARSCLRHAGSSSAFHVDISGRRRQRDARPARPESSRCRVAKMVASRGTPPSKRCSSPPPTMVWKIGFRRWVTASTWKTCRSASRPVIPGELAEGAFGRAGAGQQLALDDDLRLGRYAHLISLAANDLERRAAQRPRFPTRHDRPARWPLMTRGSPDRRRRRQAISSPSPRASALR